MNVITNFRYKPFNTLLIFLLASVVLFSTCKKPTDGVNLIFNTKTLVKAPTLVTFISANGKTGAALPSTFSVTIGGPNAALVQTDIGKQNFTVYNGLLAISLNKDAAPTLNNPVVFSINASIPGFAPVSKTITINYDTVYIQTIPVFQSNKTAQGVSSLAISTNLTGNAANATTLQTTIVANSGSKPATLTIPTGTQFLDASRNIINGSSMQANVVYTGLLNNVSAVLSNTDMHTTNAIGKDGNLINGIVNFKAVGVLNVNMNEGGSIIKSFSKPISANLELASGQTNYTNGNLIAVGDTIPLWSQNENTGQWKYEGVANVIKNSDGNLAASFNIKHLSNWALLYTQANPDYIPAKGQISITCSDKNIVLYPNTWVQFYDITDPTLSTNIYISDGKLSGYLINGHSYTLISVYNGTVYASGQFTANRNTIPPTTGSDFSFSVDYKPDPTSTKNVNVLYFTASISGGCN